MFDKFKKILFDEEEVEVTINTNKLPDKQFKKTASSKGFKDYHQDEQIEEDTIKEVIVPKDDEMVKEETKPIPVVEPERKSVFPVDDFDDYQVPVAREEYPQRTQRYAPVTNTAPQRPQPTRTSGFGVAQKEVQKPVSALHQEPHKNYRVEPPKPKLFEEKDYKKYIADDKVKGGKKPFKVTPIISPVYGILDKNYRPSEVVNKAETNPSREGRKPNAKQPKVEAPKQSLKQDLVELNSTINEMINDKPAKPEKPAIEKIAERKKEKPKYEIGSTEIPRITKTKKSINDMELPQTKDIEDEFESTSELNKIREYDKSLAAEMPVHKNAIEESVPEEFGTRDVSNYNVEEVPSHDDVEVVENKIDEADFIETDDYDSTPSISLDELLKNNNQEEESEEDRKLDNTIETDLFNLINSMYQDDDDEE